MATQIFMVRKANGTQEPFSEEKLLHSMKASGVASPIQQDALKRVKKHLYNGITTQEIHRSLEALIHQEDPRAVGRFNLKQAIMALGPTGYPFERFVGRLLEEYGYTTQVGTVLPGACVTHEVDVYAKKDSREYFVECKYHNLAGTSTDVKVVMYVKARGDDLRDRLLLEKKDPHKFQYEPWIFTNTKFSSDAIAYASCQQIRLTGWNYPEEHSLASMIEEKKEYPITVLSSLGPDHRRTLFENNCVLLSDVTKKGSACERLPLPNATRLELEKEVQYLTHE